MQSHILCHATWELPTYRRHCEVSKQWLEEELKNLEKEMEKDLKDLDDFEKDSYFREVNDYWIETAETLPRLQWYSQLLIVYGYFEKLLNDFCQEQRNEKQLKLSFKDLHGQGIERSKNYLIKVIGIKNSFSTSEWQVIKTIGVLRNAIAHRDGFVDYEPEKTNSTYSKLSGIEGVELRREIKNQEDAQIFFNENVVINALNVFDRFVRILDTEINIG